MTSPTSQVVGLEAGELELHRAWMRRVAASRLDDRHGVDDVVQEAFVSALSTEDVPEEGRLQAWLFSIVVRRCADHLRKSYGENRRVETVGEVIESREATGLDEWLLAAERDALIQSSLAELPPEERLVLELHYAEEETYAAIAERLGTSERAVEYRLTRARGRLRTILQSRVRAGDL